MKATARLYVAISLTFFSFLLTSCEEFVQAPPPETELVKEIIFQDASTAIAAVSSLYLQMSQSSYFANGGLSIFAGCYADELTSYASANTTSQFPAFYFNNVVPSNGIVTSVWGTCYNLIYSANLIIEGLEMSNLPLSLKNQLQGEAYFIRAFCHFYLVNLFGEVPLVISSDYRVNAKISRSSVENVNNQIIDDLVRAKNLLTDSYPSSGRVRANRGAATALLARVYLFVGDFSKAEEQATEVLNKTSQYKLLTDFNGIFLKESEEAIFQLLPNGGADLSTYEGTVFILLAPPTNVALTASLVDSFEPGDLRRSNWIKSLSSSSGLTTWYYAYKYKQTGSTSTGTECSMVLRLAEQYLIRGEARAKLGKIIGENSAQSDINLIRSRAGLPNTTAASDQEILLAIESERRAELFTEWGHRFFDLKRTGRIDNILASIKPNWKTTHKLLPIPQSEILINQNLEPQNPGY